MSQTITPPPPPTRFPNRPPRINIQKIPSNNVSVMGSMPPTAQPPLTAQTAHTLGPGSIAGQPYWPAYSNPFAAGNFMARGFDGFVDFTKSGMSSGEKFTYALYSKFSKWSKKWFTHIFLFMVIFLYTIGGAYLFMKIEGKADKKIDRTQLLTTETINVQTEFLKAIRQLTKDHEQHKYNDSHFDDQLKKKIRDHRAAVESMFVVNTNEVLANVEIVKDPWTFWNAMFYCGTIYTTIAI